MAVGWFLGEHDFDKGMLLKARLEREVSLYLRALQPRYLYKDLFQIQWLEKSRRRCLRTKAPTAKTFCCWGDGDSLYTSGRQQRVP